MKYQVVKIKRCKQSEYHAPLGQIRFRDAEINQAHTYADLYNRGDCPCRVEVQEQP